MKQKIKATSKKKKQKPVKCKIFEVVPVDVAIKLASEQITKFLADGKNIIIALQSSNERNTYITIFYRDRDKE